MTWSIHLFVIPLAGGVPLPRPAFTITAEKHDAALEAVRSRLIADGLRVRSVSFGPAGIVAYAEERAP